MIVKTLASACLLLEIHWQKGRQPDKMHTCTHSLPTFLATPSTFLSLSSTEVLKNNFFVEAYHPPLASCKLLTLVVWVKSYCLEKSCLQMEEPVCLEKEEHHVLQYPPS
jgi:hypothetical protein